MTMLMSNRNFKGCKCCACDNHNSKGRKSNRRIAKRQERQKWKKECNRYAYRD